MVLEIENMGYVDIREATVLKYKYGDITNNEMYEDFKAEIKIVARERVLNNNKYLVVGLQLLKGNLLTNLVVHPDYRGRGIGRKLIKKALGYLRNRTGFCYCDDSNTAIKYILTKYFNAEVVDRFEGREKSLVIMYKIRDTDEDD